MKLSKSDIAILCRAAIGAAKKAGALINEYVDKNVIVQNKKGADSLASQVVTEVDLKAQEIILKELNPTLLNYDLALLTEESVDDKSRFEKDYFWCIDPMDGTLAFTEKTPGYAVSIALVSKFGEAVLGVVFDPLTGNLYHAIQGMGAFKNEGSWQPDLSTVNSETFTLLIDRSFVEHKQYNFFTAEIKNFAKSVGINKLKLHRNAGAVLNAIWVLENTPACYFKLPKKKPGGGSLWDFAATTCIFNETGACVSDLNGHPLELNQLATTYMNKKGVLFASNPEIQNLIFNLYQKLSV